MSIHLHLPVHTRRFCFNHDHLRLLHARVGEVLRAVERAGVFDEMKLAWVNRHYLKLCAPDRLVTLAERRIARELKIQGFLAAVTTTLQAGVSVYEKPDLWRDTISMNYGTGTGNNTRNFLFTRSRLSLEM